MDLYVHAVNWCLILCLMSFKRSIVRFYIMWQQMCWAEDVDRVFESSVLFIYLKMSIELLLQSSEQEHALIWSICLTTISSLGHLKNKYEQGNRWLRAFSHWQKNSSPSQSNAECEWYAPELDANDFSFCRRTTLGLILALATVARLVVLGRLAPGEAVLDLVLWTCRLQAHAILVAFGLNYRIKKSQENLSLHWAFWQLLARSGTGAAGTRRSPCACRTCRCCSLRARECPSHTRASRATIRSFVSGMLCHLAICAFQTKWASPHDLAIIQDWRQSLKTSHYRRRRGVALALHCRMGSSSGNHRDRQIRGSTGPFRPLASPVLAFYTSWQSIIASCKNLSV